MNYVAAALLLMLNEPSPETQAERSVETNPPQETAFWILYALTRHHGMADIWRNKMPGCVLTLARQKCDAISRTLLIERVVKIRRLSRCIYLYNQLLQIHFRDLYLHLRQIGMHPSFLATQVARCLPHRSAHCNHNVGSTTGATHSACVFVL